MDFSRPFTDSPPAALLCFDFDGTLVDKPSDPYDIANLESRLAHLRRRGAAWGINTGRSLLHTLEGLREHGFQSIPDFIIARESEIYHRTAERRWGPLGDWNLRCLEVHRHFYKSHARFFKLLRRHLAAELKGARFIEDHSEPAGIVTNDEPLMERVVHWIEAHRNAWPDLAYQRNSIWLRFTHRNYNKGSALLEIRRLSGIGPEFTFVAGDNHNDFPMLHTEVAHGIACPANAIPEISSHVASLGGYVANHSATKGITAALEHFFYQDPSDWAGA